MIVRQLLLLPGLATALTSTATHNRKDYTVFSHNKKVIFTERLT